MSFFDDFDWGSLAKNVLQAVPGVVAATTASRRAQQGNTQAARIATQNTSQAIPIAQNTAQQQIQAVTGGNDAAIQSIQGGDAAAIADLEKIRAQAASEGAPAISQYRATLARPTGVLTPGQAIQLEDSTRALNNSNLLGRMGGRSFSAAVADNTRRYRAGAVDTNEAARERAAGALARRADLATNVGAQIANAKSNTGRAVGNIQAGQGRAVSDITGRAGENVIRLGTAGSDVAAGAAAANAQSQADTMGAIGSYFAQAAKDADEPRRRSRYNAEVWRG